MYIRRTMRCQILTNYLKYAKKSCNKFTNYNTLEIQRSDSLLVMLHGGIQLDTHPRIHLLLYKSTQNQCSGTNFCKYV